MYNINKYLFFLIIIIFTGCGDSNDTKTTKEASTEKKENQAAPQTGGEEGIIGEWKQIIVTSDENGNGQIESNEREKGAVLDDYMKLNSDGSAVFHIYKAEGTYKIKTNESSGKKYLYLYDRSGTEYSKGSIHSVTKDELILIHKLGGDSYTIWKRQ